jgi:hypothetical protein
LKFQKKVKAYIGVEAWWGDAIFVDCVDMASMIERVFLSTADERPMKWLMI